VDWEVVGRVVAAVTPVVVAVVGLTRGPSRLRGAIRHDAETLKDLPQDGAAARAMEDLLVQQIEQLNRRSSPDATRDWPMLVVALVASPLLGWLAVGLFARGGALWGTLAVGVGTMALLFLYGIFEAGQKVPRDNKGFRRGGTTEPAASVKARTPSPREGDSTSLDLSATPPADPRSSSDSGAS